MQYVFAIIPAYNEEESIAYVIQDIPDNIVNKVIVCDNNSTDNTSINAKKAGAVVLFEEKKGYGHACMKALKYAENQENKPDIIVFLDGDYADFPEQIPELIAPIIDNNYDMVIGSRATGKKEKGSLTFPQLFGNWLASRLIKWIYNYTFTDLGPFRAIKFDKLIQLNMQETAYGWTVEMQVKAVKQNYKCCEIPVKYRKRIGKSKVSGTTKGTILAGYRIIFTIFKLIFIRS